ncbi:FlgO family outer membrane protein [Aestuariibacter sp. AA17]|uniref:FlgO family outer membrane protein n=1 Tax=Fluctibacter corallii TaxID=2984329 RepID=A0ABT3ABC9_9ALTE|nr:FlgO family outer membrane protein [Aestuariibacter sp. AA17]MCV2885902.1 FlgO family outer membrane protein [Aestuariibacter sp. AA17]
MKLTISTICRVANRISKGASLCITLIGLSVLSGCAHVKNMTSNVNEERRGFGSYQVNDTPDMYQKADLSLSSTAMTGDEIQDYVREMVNTMADNMTDVSDEARIAVTNFVPVDSDYTHTPYLGEVLNHAFISELYRFGLVAMDFKVADYIRVTPKGDFILTRDFLELRNETQAEFVLVGTLSQLAKGVLVHARMVDVASKTVVATSESMIPARVASQFATMSSHAWAER